MRLIATVVGATPYERALTEPESAALYLLAETLSQDLLLGWVVVLALLVYLGLPAGRNRRGGARDWLLAGFLLLPFIGIMVAVDILAGVGIKLKGALTFAIGVLMMVLAVAMAARGVGTVAPDDRRVTGLARLVVLGALTIVLSATAKSAAW